MRSRQYEFLPCVFLFADRVNPTPTDKPLSEFFETLLLTNSSSLVIIYNQTVTRFINFTLKTSYDVWTSVKPSKLMNSSSGIMVRGPAAMLS